MIFFVIYIWSHALIHYAKLPSITLPFPILNSFINLQKNSITEIIILTSTINDPYSHFKYPEIFHNIMNYSRTPVHVSQIIHIENMH